MPETLESGTSNAGRASPTDYVQDGAVLLGCSRKGRELVPESIELKLANRHGLVTGATGTGKTVTLQILPKASPPPASPYSPPTSRVTCPASP
jgi:Cdc6-like AAA superfamily ATPase